LGIVINLNNLKWKYLLINLFLSALIIVFLVFKLHGIWTIPTEEVQPSKKASIEKEKIETPQVKKEIVTYQIIAQKDLFRPSRTELKSEAIKSPLPLTPPPKLFGVVIMDNDRIAILEDPSSNRRKTYRTGEGVGDFTISEIEKEKVILLRGEEKVAVNLRETKTIAPPAKAGDVSTGLTPGAVPTRRTPEPVSTRPTPEPMPAPPQGPPVPIEPQNNLLWYSY
jgi:hypothetical protein